jgi:hypothetical protein
MRNGAVFCFLFEIKINSLAYLWYDATETTFEKLYLRRTLDNKVQIAVMFIATHSRLKYLDLLFLSLRSCSNWGLVYKYTLLNKFVSTFQRKLMPPASGCVSLAQVDTYVIKE